MSAEDWSKAETLAIDYLEKEKQASAPIQLHRFEIAPFLFAARWSDGQSYVLVFDDKVQTTRGMALLPAYFAFLGEARLRAIDVGTLGGLLQIFEAQLQGFGAPLTSGNGFQDLFPAIVDSDGVLKYVVHHFAPTPTGIPHGGSRLPGQIVIYRFTLQLFPVPHDLVWRHEAEIERPAPPPPSLR
jgi:hypothetical protein